MIADDYATIRANMAALRQQPDIVKWIDGDTAYYMARTPHGVEVLSRWHGDSSGRYPFVAPGITREELVGPRSLRLPIIERLAKPPKTC